MISAKMSSNNYVRTSVTMVAALLISASLPGQRAQQTISLDPPAGWELQTHSRGPNGNMFPAAPPNFRRLGVARVGELADLHTLTLRFAQTTKLTRITSTRDFRIEQGSSCVSGNTYGTGATCRLLVRFTPQGAGQKLGRITIQNSSSATPFALGLLGYSYMPTVSFTPAVISTLPGTYPSNVGLLKGAQNLSIDGGDTLYVADTGNNVVRMRDSSGTFTSISSGATAPVGVAADSFGEVWFSEPAANLLMEIFAYGPQVQGNGSGTDPCLASSPCTLSSESVSKPGSITIDANDTMFFTESTKGTAFSQIHPEPPTLVRLYDPFTYQTASPGTFAVDANSILYSAWTTAGNCQISAQTLYAAENSQGSYSKVAGGRICGFSGDGGIARNAEISKALGQFAFDVAGNLYFTDTGNQRVRRIDAATGIINTIAGSGTAGYTGDSGPATSATLRSPTGVGVDSLGQVYIISNSAATGNAQVIRKVGPTGLVAYGNQVINTASAVKMVTVSNTGNAPLMLTSASFVGVNPTAFSIDSTTTNCILTPGATLNAGASCKIGILFNPPGTGAKTARLRLLDNTVTGMDDIALNGNGVLPSATFTITSPTSGQSFKSGTSVTFAVSVTSATGPAPTGKVQFKVDGANYGAAVTLSSGKASTTVTGLTIASHTLSATYSGDANYAPGGPISVTISVTAALPGIMLAPITDASAPCGGNSFSVTVSGVASMIPTGTVELLEGSDRIASGSLHGGVAFLSAGGMHWGSHLIHAHYSGDAHYLGADSATIRQMKLSLAACRTPATIITGR